MASDPKILETNSLDVSSAPSFFDRVYLKAVINVDKFEVEKLTLVSLSKNLCSFESVLCTKLCPMIKEKYRKLVDIMLIPIKNGTFKMVNSV